LGLLERIKIKGVTGCNKNRRGHDLANAREEVHTEDVDRVVYTKGMVSEAFAGFSPRVNFF
jgi:hypothetical protein